MFRVFIIFSLLFFSYLTGSVPVGYWISRFCFGVDVTKFGSGNIGATNVARVLGKKYFFPIFLLDFFKAFSFLFLADYFLLQYFVEYKVLVLVFCSIFLLIGNAFSCFMGFKGGKGVATSLGIFAFLYPPYFVIASIIIWALSFAIFKKSYIASILSILSLPIFNFLAFLYGSNLAFLFDICLYYMIICFFAVALFTKGNLVLALHSSFLLFCTWYFYGHLTLFSFNEIQNLLFLAFVSLWIFARHIPNISKKVQ